MNPTRAFPYPWRPARTLARDLALVVAGDLVAFPIAAWWSPSGRIQNPGPSLLVYAIGVSWLGYGGFNLGV
ncbi:MAG: hypothetical protein C4327_08015 [Meiothermus sp.]